MDDKVTVRAETRTVKVDYLVEPSDPVLFDTLIIRNQRAAPADTLEGITRDAMLRSLVKYDKGDTIRISGTDRLIEKLQYTGAFNYVRIKDSLMPGPAHGSALILQVEERIPGNFRTSTFYETYSGFGVSADMRHSNIAGSLNEVRGGGALASLRQSVYAGYGSPLTFGYLIRFDDDFSVNWYQDQSVHHPGTDSSEGLFAGDFRAINSARITWPWSYWLRLVGNAEVESKSRMLGPDSRERSLNLNFIQTAFVAFLNQALDPTRGVRVAPSWGNGGPLIEDNKFRFTEFRHNWLEIQSGYYWYHPSFKQAKLAMRLDGGRFFGEGGTNSDRFFLGGGRSVRSYGFQGIVPGNGSRTGHGRKCDRQGMFDQEPDLGLHARFLRSAARALRLRIAPLQRRDETSPAPGSGAVLRFREGMGREQRLRLLRRGIPAPVPRPGHGLGPGFPLSLAGHLQFPHGFALRPWPGQLLARRLDHRSGPGLLIPTRPPVPILDSQQRTKATVPWACSSKSGT